MAHLNVPGFSENEEAPITRGPPLYLVLRFSFLKAIYDANISEFNDNLDGKHMN
jgi:hypothetical protein